MSYDLDIEAMLSALRIGEEKVSDKAVKSAEQRVAVMRDYVEAPRSEVIDALTSAFRDAYGGRRGSIDRDVVEAARSLAETKFATDEWNKRL
jgi:lipoate-protein ligase A